jgi:imidazole glycerol-phosphate synthase subunit HisH
LIAVIDYGAGNLRSITNGLRKVGAHARVVDLPGSLTEADGIVLPGVGAFGDAMGRLERFRPAISSAVKSGIPFLGLCLGEQVIFDASEESPGVAGLGLFRGRCMRFAGGLKVPHMGWNTITIVKDTPLFSGIEDGEHFYFVHGYYPVPDSGGIVAATTEYGISFASAIAEGHVFATQFHPEKSGDAGLAVLANFLSITRR